MKVLVLGGTGAMGVHLVQLLANSDVEAYVTSRNYKANEGKIQYIQGNAKDINFLKSVLTQEWDAIVDFMVYSTSDFKKRVNLLLDSTSQYIFLSSARVYADSEEPIKETSPRLLNVSTDKEFMSTDEYSLTKARQEDILLDTGYKNWTIIRPYITYSENRVQLGVLEKEEWLYRALKGRSIVFSEEINGKMTTLTYGFDVSNSIKKIIGKNETLGKTFHITLEKSYKWEHILNIYLNILERHLGFRPKVIFQTTSAFLEWKNSEYQVKYDRLYNREFDNLNISKLVNTSDFTGIEIGLEKSLNSFLYNPVFKAINWNQEAQKDKIAKEWTSLFEIPNFKQKIGYIIYRFIDIKKIKL